MAHARHFDPDDPVLAAVREIALAFPGADEKETHGRPAFFTKKVFAYYGGSIKRPDGWEEHGQAVVVLPSAEDDAALREDGRFWVPGYLGPYGWLGIDVGAVDDLTEIAELIEESYRRTASKTLIRELDAGRGAR